MKPVFLAADRFENLGGRNAMGTDRPSRVRGLPVIDGHRLVGIIAESDIAAHAAASDVGETVEAITST